VNRVLMLILLLMSFALIMAIAFWSLRSPAAVVRERVMRTPEQQWAWQEHQHREWEWNKAYANREFKRCLAKFGYDKCMGRTY
jgi:hypothetical protein